VSHPNLDRASIMARDPFAKVIEHQPRIRGVTKQLICAFCHSPFHYFLFFRKREKDAFNKQFSVEA
jgi:hypothetical protein